MPLTDAATAPDPDLLVVGAGAAGIGAATAAAAQGLSVVLLTEAGGVAPADPIAGVMVRPGETVWSVAGGFRIDTIGPQGPRHLHAAALVDASGAQDWIIPFPGWDLPGVLGLHEAERLMAAQRTPPGRRVLVAGCGDRLIDVAAAVLAVGGTVAAIVDLGATTPRGWNGVAVLHQATLGGATAEDGALQVAVRGLDGDDTVRMIVADAIAVAHAAVPSTAITRLMRAAHAYDAARGAWHPVIDHDGRTSVRCLYVAGETAAQGTRTGLAVARDLGRPPASVIRASAAAAAAAGRRSRGRLAAAPSRRHGRRDGGVPLRGRASRRHRRGGSGGGRRSEPAQGLDALRHGTLPGALLRRHGRVSAGRTGHPSPPLRAVHRPHPAAPGAAGPAHRYLRLCRHRAATGRAAVTGRVDVAVIGAGVMGATTALHLARAGMRVALIDRGPICREASGVNAGTLTLHMTRAALIPYAIRGRDLWLDAARWLGRDAGATATPGLCLAFTAAEETLLEARVAARRAAGAPIALVTTAEARAIEPGLTEAVRAAAHCPLDGHVTAYLTGRVFRQALVGAGAAMLESWPVAGIDTASGGFTIRSADGGRVQARRLVLAGGVWLERMLAWFGLHIPVKCLVNQLIVTAPMRPVMQSVVSIANGLLSLKQFAHGSVLIGGGWQGIGDPDRGGVEAVPENLIGNVRLARHAIPALAAGSVVRIWLGLELETADAMPMIGPVPGVPDAFVIGCVHSGYTSGPFMGKLLADRILDQEPEMPLFDPARLLADDAA